MLYGVYLLTISCSTKILFHFLFAGLLVGSAAFRTAPPADDFATLYIYRGGQFMGAALNYTIFVNGTKICKLSNERYLEDKAKPGKLTLTAERGGIEVFKKETGLDLPVEASHSYYVRGDLKTSFTRSRLELSEVPENTAKRDMAKLTPDQCQEGLK